MVFFIIQLKKSKSNTYSIWILNNIWNSNTYLSKLFGHFHEINSNFNKYSQVLALQTICWNDPRTKIFKTIVKKVFKNYFFEVNLSQVFTKFANESIKLIFFKYCWAALAESFEIHHTKICWNNHISCLGIARQSYTTIYLSTKSLKMVK